ncbi:unnamed protein product [Vitrella brassicaformis CCMP3155]|uniref:EF-hand domain-containing protein n=1 Tax=Vitrella brassicaformis (strain CCMP3155) TaxID=1169540 RepID=A0A0G4GPN3_VITBC|nr:unnamed protein product [Vitrella brassicaformis CCMP3155]|eukprot:CEM32252.1 unnamed protein product [Vitrella brassicaformis CCMP3155]
MQGASNVSSPPTTARQLEEAERKEIERAFDLFDEDKSGEIEKKEVKQRMMQIGFSESQAEEACGRVFGNVDQGGDNNISWDEFRKTMSAKLGPDSSDNDIDKAWISFGGADGKITLSELKKVAEKVGETMDEDDLTGMIKMFASGTDKGKTEDKDKYFITKEDFTKIMREPLNRDT